MRKFNLKLITLGVGLALSFPTFAGEPGDSMKTPLMAGRTSLLAMLDAPEADVPALEAEMNNAAAALDAVIATASANQDSAAKVKEFQVIWEEFKATRANELVPAIKAGKKDEAKALAQGIQAERMGKMKVILVELGAAPDEEKKPEEKKEQEQPK
jgi:hypothetical protein